MVWGWVVVGCLLWCGVGEGEGKRPELVESSVWFSPNATLVNVNFDLAIIQMVFFFFFAFFFLLFFFFSFLFFYSFLFLFSFHFPTTKKNIFRPPFFPPLSPFLPFSLSPFPPPLFFFFRISISPYIQTATPFSVRNPNILVPPSLVNLVIGLPKRFFSFSFIFLLFFSLFFLINFLSYFY